MRALKPTSALSGSTGKAVWAPSNTTEVRTNGSHDATFRGRLGFAVDRSLFYVTGGAILADFGSNMHLIGGFPIAPSPRTGSQWGWTVGRWRRWALDPRWSIKGEYLYYDAGTETVKVPNCGVGGCGFSIGNTGNLVRIGVNYRFGAP